MKVFILFSVLISAFLLSIYPENLVAMESKKILWMSDYDKAVTLAKSSSKPVVLFFTGSDWCSWCAKIEKEVLNTSEFSDAISDKMLFVKIDFPNRTKLDQKIVEQNGNLQKKFMVKSFPTIILIDPEQQLIGMTGYRAGGGKPYAQHLMRMVNEYTAYKKQRERLGSHSFTGKELKRLYQKARELGLENDAQILIGVGVNSDQSHFFLTEQYRNLVNNQQIQSQEAQKVKKQLLEGDPENQNLTHYQVALIEFEALSEEALEGELDPNKAVLPLVTYIEQFGSEDQENLWRLHMVISQVYLEKNKYQEALKHAQSSYAAAPPSIQPELSIAIKNIQLRLASETNK